MSDPDGNMVELLLADDDEDDCLLFREAIDQLPFLTNLTIVHDGERLLEYLSKITAGNGNRAYQLPDAVFLDLNMPRKNGIAALQEIKANNLLKHIPVIIFSTSYDESIAELLYQNGVHYFICKPPEFLQLTNVIHQAIVLTTLQGRRSIVAQPPFEKFLLGKLKEELL